MAKGFDSGETPDDFSRAHKSNWRNSKATEAYSSTDFPVLRRTKININLRRG
jgi:hypothetical protein